MTDKPTSRLSSVESAISSITSSLSATTSDSNGIYWKFNNGGWFFAVDKSEGNFPPYNLQQFSDGVFRLSMAVAGYKRHELTVYVEGDFLVIKGAKDLEENVDDSTFLHRGIALRTFTRTFKMVVPAEVNVVKLEDGLLSLTLVQIKPDDQRKILTIE